MFRFLSPRSITWVPKEQPRRVKINLVVAFDSAITLRDTTPALRLVAQKSALRPEAVTNALWKDLEAKYTSNWAKVVEAELNKPSSLMNIGDFNQFLDQVDKMELESISRTTNSKLFSGIKRNDSEIWKEAVAEAKAVVRPGAEDFIKAALRLMQTSAIANFHILSLSWSKTFISKTLEQPASFNSHITANEFETDAQQVTTGQFTGGIHTSAEKLKRLQELVAKPPDAAAGDIPYVVYVGDSLTDLRCLLAANTGLLLVDAKAPDSNSLRACERFGIQVFEDYREAKAASTVSPQSPPSIIKVTSFNQVSEILSEIQKKYPNGAISSPPPPPPAQPPK